MKIFHSSSLTYIAAKGQAGSLRLELGNRLPLAPTLHPRVERLLSDGQVRYQMKGTLVGSRSHTHRPISWV